MFAWTALRRQAEALGRLFQRRSAFMLLLSLGWIIILHAASFVVIIFERRTQSNIIIIINITSP